jgi:ADP-heptose:LPS heptosyltransferase
MNVTSSIDCAKTTSALFVRLGKLGDMMVASMLVNRVRRAYPHLTIGLLTLPRSRELFRYSRDIDILKTWQPATLPILALTERLRGWDLLADLNDEPSRRSVLALQLVRPRHSLAFRNANSEGVFDVTVQTPRKEGSHVLERFALFARALGIEVPSTELRPVVTLKPGSLDAAGRAQRAIVGHDGRVVALNLSAGHESRRWASAKWEVLANALLAVSPRVYLRLLNAPHDDGSARLLRSTLPSGRVLPPAGRSLDDFLAAIATSNLLVSADTSAVHAACAFDVPVLGLYPEAYWNYVSWRPLGERNCTIRSRGEGVDLIPAQEVIEAAVRMLGGETV